MNAMMSCVHNDIVSVDDHGGCSTMDHQDDDDKVFSQFIKDHVNATANLGRSRLQTHLMRMGTFHPTLVQSMNALTP